jgi:hypothetical protein
MKMFDQLNGLDLNSFVKKILDNKLFKNEKEYNYFWHSYISEHRFFETIFQGENAVDFLKLYLKRESNISIPLLEKIVTINPEAVTNSFRLTRSFLNEAHFQSISFFANSSSNLLKIHYKAFDALRNKEKNLYDAALLRGGVHELNPIELIFIISFHYEYKMREHRLKSEPILEHAVDDYLLIQTYNIILSFSINQKEKDFANSFNAADVIKTCRLLIKKDFIDDISIYFDSFNQWYKWYEFVHNKLDTYCFDLNYSVTEVAEGIEFYPININEKVQRNASSFADSIFYSKWDQNAAELAPEFIKSLIDNNPEKFLDRTPDLKEIMHLSSYFQHVSKSLLISFYYGLDPINSKKQLAVLKAFSNAVAETNATYVKEITSIYNSNEFDWLMGLLKNKLTGDFENFPIQIIPYEKWKAKYFLDFETESKDNNLLLIFDFNNDRISFNRFKPFLNLWQTPFLKFGNTVCYIKPILADMDPAIVVLESILNDPSKERNKEQKEETKLQETRFADIFKDYGFENVFGQFELVTFNNNEMKTIGECDLLVWDKNEILIIELKRSRLRLTSEEQWKEQFEVLNHATTQLKKLTTHIKSNPGSLLKPCNLTAKQVSESNITGCVINMYHHLDGTQLADNIYKTSFVSLFNILKKCRSTSENKVSTFIELASKPFLDPKELNLKPGQYNFVISEK